MYLQAVCTTASNDCFLKQSLTRKLNYYKMLHVIMYTFIKIKWNTEIDMKFWGKKFNCLTKPSLSLPSPDL